MMRISDMLDWLARKVPDCFRSWSTSVVLPWSTWAMMAMLRMCSMSWAIALGSVIFLRSPGGPGNAVWKKRARYIAVESPGVNDSLSPDGGISGLSVVCQMVRGLGAERQSDNQTIRQSDNQTI